MLNKLKNKSHTIRQITLFGTMKFIESEVYDIVRETKHTMTIVGNFEILESGEITKTTLEVDKANL